MVDVIHRSLRWLFFGLIVRPVIQIILGLNVSGREHLPIKGPAILAANHNSHLDTMVLMTLVSHRVLHRVRPVAAADYFLSNPTLAWFSTRIIGILPIARRRKCPNEDPLQACHEALDNGDILIFFPEGTRGKPEQMSEFKSGIARLAQCQPEVPVVPVFMHGLGKALPKGEALLVPFTVDVFVGESLRGAEHGDEFLVALRQRLETLAEAKSTPAWD